MDNKIRVFMVDDHTVVRHCIGKHLVSDGRIEVVGHAANGQECLDRVPTMELDIVLLDLNMPGLDGITLCARLTGGRPPYRVLVMTMHDEPVYAERAFGAGAAGYLLKTGAYSELHEAIDTVFSGGRYISQPMRYALANRMIERHTGWRSVDDLSAREFELLCLLSSGNTAKECARRMAITQSTISTFRARILDKLGLSTTAAMIRFAIEHGIGESTGQGLNTALLAVRA